MSEILVEQRSKRKTSRMFIFGIQRTTYCHNPFSSIFLNYFGFIFFSLHFFYTRKSYMNNKSQSHNCLMKMIQ